MKQVDYTHNSRITTFVFPSAIVVKLGPLNALDYVTFHHLRLVIGLFTINS